MLDTSGILLSLAKPAASQTLSILFLVTLQASLLFQGIRYIFVPRQLLFFQPGLHFFDTTRGIEV
jgi:hypothetical protein